MFGPTIATFAMATIDPKFFLPALIRCNAI